MFAGFAVSTMEIKDKNLKYSLANPILWLVVASVGDRYLEVLKV